MNVPSYWHKWKPINAHTAHALHHAHTYPAATQKGVADLCLHQLHCKCILVLRFSPYIVIDMHV